MGRARIGPVVRIRVLGSWGWFLKCASARQPLGGLWAGRAGARGLGAGSCCKGECGSRCETASCERTLQVYSSSCIGGASASSAISIAAPQPATSLRSPGLWPTGTNGQLDLVCFSSRRRSPPRKAVSEGAVLAMAERRIVRRNGTKRRVSFLVILRVAGSCNRHGESYRSPPAQEDHCSADSPGINSGQNAASPRHMSRPAQPQVRFGTRAYELDEASCNGYTFRTRLWFISMES